MKILFGILFTACVFFSCTEKRKSAPTDLIGPDQFADILVDVRLLEGSYSAKYRRVDSSDYNIESYYQRLYQDHGITRDRFLSSYAYYTADLPEMMKIEDVVINKLTTLLVKQDSLNRVINIQQRDSLGSDTIQLNTPTPQADTSTHKLKVIRKS
jgi:hypothetical protein